MASLLVAATALLGISQVGAAQASVRSGVGSVIASQTDESGDVKILGATGPGTPGLVARRSIDLRKVTVVDQDTSVRITVALARILVNSKYDQIVDVQMKPATGAGTWFLDVTMSGQEPTSATATYSADLSGDNTRTCSPLLAAVDPVAGTVAVSVPNECLPTDAAKIRVYSSLGHLTTPGPGFSLDKLRVRGQHLMHP